MACASSSAQLERTVLLRRTYARLMISEQTLLVQSSIDFAKQQRLCVRGDCIVALHRIGNASVIKIVDIK